MDGPGEADGSVFAPSHLLYWQKTRGRHRIRNAQHVHIFFHLFSLRCVRLYVAWHSSGVGRSFFLPNTEIMDPLFSFSSSILFGKSRKHRGRQAHSKREGSNVYPCSATDVYISLICHKSVTTQNLGFFELLVQKETFADALLIGIVSKCSFKNSPLECSCVVVTLIENCSTSKPLEVSLEKSQILSCDTLVANERFMF